MLKTTLGISLLALAVGALAPSQASALTIKEKLNREFVRYQDAQNLAAEKVGAQGQAISRDDWEKLLQGTPKETLTADDIAKIVKAQDKVIARSAYRAAKASVLNLNPLRGNPAQLAKFCQELPKGGMLHVHPSGTPDHATVQKLLDLVNPPVSYNKIADLVKGSFYPQDTEFLKPFDTPVTYSQMSDSDKAQLQELFFLPPGNHPFSRFNGLFTINSLIKTQDDTSTNIVYDDFLARAHSEGVRYVEFTKDYPLSPGYLPKIEAWTNTWRQKYNIDVHFNYSFARYLPGEKNRKLAQALLALPHSDALTGIDLLADESTTPALETGQLVYALVLSRVKDGKSSLHRTMHAGELGDLRNVRDALILGSERIGHGVKLIQDPVTLEYASRHQIPVEINLISNVRLEAIDDIYKHPYLKYLRLGLRPSLSTDDEGMLDTDIDKECRTAISTSNVTYAEIKQLEKNSISTSFATDDVKARLLADLQQDFVKFEQNWSRELPR